MLPLKCFSSTRPPIATTASRAAMPAETDRMTIRFRLVMRHHTDLRLLGGLDMRAASGVAAAPRAPAASQGSAAPQVGAAAGPAYSGTNTAVPGVDEPDLVKTDGRRIVAIEGDRLTVVDAATRQVTGTLRL